MKLQNSTTWPDHFLRRMASWCCRELDGAVKVRACRFASTHRAFGGRAYLQSMRIGVRIGCKERFPSAYRIPGFDPSWESGFEGRPLADREEALVKVTAHELAHLEAYQRGDRTRGRGGKGGSEHSIQRAAQRVLVSFRVRRDELLAAWNQEPAARPERVKADPIDAKLDAAEAAVARWQRKAKLAATKLRKYRRQVTYYTRKAAERAPA